MQQQRYLMPARLLCSCGERFPSDHAMQHNSSMDKSASPLRLYLVHAASRSFSHHDATPHSPEALCIRCLYCSAIVDVNRFRQHLVSGECHGGSNLMHSVQNYRNMYRDASCGRLPSFHCVAHDTVASSVGTVASIMQHKHGSGSVPIDFRLFVSCNRCGGDGCIDLAEAVNHSLEWHSDRASPEDVADCFSMDASDAGRIRIDADAQPPSGYIADSLADAEVKLEAVVDDPLREDDDGLDDSVSSSSPPTNTRRLTCSLCPGKSFASRKTFNEHRRQQHRQYIMPERCRRQRKRIECEQCGRQFSHRNALSSHRLIHQGLRPYKCDECGKRFLQSNHLTQHRRNWHTGERPFRCQECSATYTQKIGLDSHVRRTHTNERPFRCSQCDFSSFLRDTLRTHERSHADGTTATMPPSDLPPMQSFSTAEDAEEVECPVCGERSTAKTFLIRHRRRHRAEFPYRCSLCGENFVYKGMLERHLTNGRMKNGKNRTATCKALAVQMADEAGI